MPEIIRKDTGLSPDFIRFFPALAGKKWQIHTEIAS
jgi:hypothetical protein